jgi:hypothetical protein
MWSITQKNSDDFSLSFIFSVICCIKCHYCFERSKTRLNLYKLMQNKLETFFNISYSLFESG